MVGSAMGSIFLSDLTAVASDRYNYGVNNRPVNIFVDEAAEVINDPFIQLLNKGRGAKLRLFVATQTFADFAARLGSKDKALQVLGNINNTFALRIVDGETRNISRITCQRPGSSTSCGLKARTRMVRSPSCTEATKVSV
jgi:conjugal transfer pilus assembly protein TraD